MRLPVLISRWTSKIMTRLRERSGRSRVARPFSGLRWPRASAEPVGRSWKYHYADQHDRPRLGRQRGMADHRRRPIGALSAAARQLLRSREDLARPQAVLDAPDPVHDPPEPLPPP